MTRTVAPWTLVIRPAAILGWLLLVGGLASWSSHPGIARAESRAEECGSFDVEQCDARYDPVCASWDTGIRCVRAPCPSAESRLYTNACLACRDERVLRLQHGECPDRPEPEVGRRHRIELDRLVGRRSPKERLATVVDVDLQVAEPISVVQAWIWLEGEAFPGSAESLDPSEGRVEIPVIVQVAIKDSFSSGIVDVASPVAQLGPFDGRFKAEARLGAMSRRFGPTTWSMLADGRAELQLAFRSTCPDAGCRLIENAAINIRRAELVVDTRREGDLPQRDR